MNEKNTKDSLNTCISLTYQEQLITFSFNKINITQSLEYENFQSI